MQPADGRLARMQPVVDARYPLCDSDKITPMDSIMTDKAKYDLAAAKIRKAIEAEFLVPQFGLRCQDYDPNCPVCERYDMLDGMLEIPFEEAE